MLLSILQLNHFSQTLKMLHLLYCILQVTWWNITSLQSFPVFMPNRANHPVAATSYSLSLSSFMLTVAKQLQQTNISSALPNITKTTTGSGCVCYYRTMCHSVNHVAVLPGDLQLQPCKPPAAPVFVADDWWDQEVFSHHSVKTLPASWTHCYITLQSHISKLASVTNIRT